MYSNRLKQIILFRNAFYCAAAIILLVVIFQFNISVRASQITLLVESGGVEVMNPLDPTKTFKPVSGKFLTLVKDAVVRTNNGTAYMLLPGKSLISLDVFTSVELENVNNNSYVISSAYGRTWHKIQNQQTKNSYKYELKTPTARLASVGTEFELKVDKDPDSVSQVTLLQGQAFVTNSQTQVIQQVDKGKQTQIKEGDLNVKVQDVSTQVTDSDFYKKNKIIGDQIDKMSATASLDTYKTVIEAASNSALSTRSKDSLTIKSDPNTTPRAIDAHNPASTKSQPKSTQIPQPESDVAPAQTLAPIQTTTQPPSDIDARSGNPINTHIPETLVPEPIKGSQVTITPSTSSASTVPQSAATPKDVLIILENPENPINSQPVTDQSTQVPKPSHLDSK